MFYLTRPPRLSTMRTPAGIFMSTVPQYYCKPALSLDDQISLLTRRGLTIPDRDKALYYLSVIGYYRLPGYFLIFLNTTPGAPSHSFRSCVTFKDILDVYIFDRELRLLVMDAIERIEVAFRTVLSNTMCFHYGPHWFMDAARFEITRFNHNDLMDKIRRETRHPSTTTSGRADLGREPFISHYYNNYCHPDLPPSWMVVEVLSFGSISNIYANLKSTDRQKDIAAAFGYHHVIIRSWLHSLSYNRNLCAHHSRLWSRIFSIPPRTVRPLEHLMRNSGTFFTQAVMLATLMHVVADGSKWEERIAELFDKHPTVDPARMGFPRDWKADSFWKHLQPSPKGEFVPINRFSSRLQRLDSTFLTPRLTGALSYDRIAGYFSSSILEVAGEALESVSGQVRIICNSDLDPQDVITAQTAMRLEWCATEPENLGENAKGRFGRLAQFIHTGKLQVKVLPNDCFGLIHGKAGVITLPGGTKTSLGSDEIVIGYASKSGKLERLCGGYQDMRATHDCKPFTIGLNA